MDPNELATNNIKWNFFHKFPLYTFWGKCGIHLTSLTTGTGMSPSCFVGLFKTWDFANSSFACKSSVLTCCCFGEICLGELSSLHSKWDDEGSLFGCWAVMTAFICEADSFICLTMVFWSCKRYWMSRPEEFGSRSLHATLGQIWLSHSPDGCMRSNENRV